MSAFDNEQKSSLQIIMNVDAALSLLGPKNGYIWFWYFLINFTKSSISAFAILAFLWSNAKPKSVRCKIPFGFSLNESVPFEDKNGEYVPNQCIQYVNFSFSTNLTIPCQLGYEYESYTTSSVTTYWNLVCDKAYLSALVDSCFFILSIFASSIFTALSDRFGRRPVFLSCVLLMSSLGTLSTFSPNVFVYMAIRTLIGPIQQGVYTTGFCFSLELFPKDRRGRPSILSELFWVASSIILCPIAYFARDWKHYTYATTVPFFLTVILIWFMPESIPWLIANGRVEEAKEILINASHYGNSKLSAHKIQLENVTELEKMNPEHNPRNPDSIKEAPTYPCYYVCTKDRLWRHTILNFIIWVTVGCSYYGLQLQAIQVGDPYLNFLIISLIETPAILLITPLSKKFGRKILSILGMFLTASLLALMIATKMFWSEFNVLLVLFPVCGRFAMSIVFTVIFVHISEMYPTNLRTMGIAVGSSSARLGVAIAPFLSMMESLYIWLPTLCLCILNLVSCFAASALPETQEWELPQTIEEVNEWSEAQTPKCCRRRSSL